ncbi:hypothetical protein SAMN02745121_04324 [Nannocystis exedens]|uniref:Uncharacterized protein n=1 Tax=Nannocystis exedens TaxID=54 RepID=A0A1I2AR91_9BACT|nr:DUF6335 family protein [Nannocystis exedens]PCC74221.1 hypothetical protein NAEX_07310 [Nannocystis exedens]SFE46366.1 hypothetical protein SAMN02745121_04324 [Nannocystis exedens]
MKKRRSSARIEPVADPERLAEKTVREYGASPDELVTEGEEGEGDEDVEPPHDSSLTAIAAETLRSGVYPERTLEKVPGQDDVLRAGDPDVDPLDNLFSGEELPGASDPTPDQNNVDEIGRAAGLDEEDDDRLAGEGLRTPAEILDERDARRWELDPRSSGRPGDKRP